MEAHWGIATLPAILRSLALAAVGLCLCILPWANVKLPGSTHDLIPWLACTAFACWLLARILEWRSPRPHEKAVWWITLLISVYGWAVTAFPRAMVDRASGAILDLDKSPWLAFGTLDQDISVQTMIFMTSALMMLVVVQDFAFERTGRYVLALAVTFGGFATAVAGLFFQTSADLASLWEVKHIPKFVFGLFWYHGNTAAFLNLSWPVSFWLCLLLLHYGLRTFRQQMALAFLVVATVVQVIAVFVVISKVGHFVLILEMALLLTAGLVVWRPHLETLPFSKKRLALFVLIAVGLVVLGAWLSGAGAMIGRWDKFSQHHFDDPGRRHAVLMALQIGVEYGSTGTGPGTFEWIAAHYTPLDPVLREGRWRHAHNDYAEFFVEWGWPGISFFVLVLVLPGWRVVKALRQVFLKDSRYQMSFERRAGLVCFFIAIISVSLHAVVDFPLQIDAIRPLFAALVGGVFAMTSTSASPSRRDKREDRKRIGGWGN